MFNGTKKKKDIYKDIADVKTSFDTLNCEFDRPLPKEKMKR